jgi:hypothetical protein
MTTDGVSGSVTPSQMLAAAEVLEEFAEFYAECPACRFELSIEDGTV